MAFDQLPNQALQPTHMLVTDRAFARSAPSIRVADLGRSATFTMVATVMIVGDDRRHASATTSTIIYS